MFAKSIKKNGHFRAGQHIPHEGVDLGEVSAEQLAVLKSDASIVLSETAFGGSVGSAHPTDEEVKADKAAADKAAADKAAAEKAAADKAAADKAAADKAAADKAAADKAAADKAAADKAAAGNKTKGK